MNTQQAQAGMSREVCGGYIDEAGRMVPRYREVTALEARIARDKRRTAVQAPISQTKLCVFYLVNGRERRSPWFYRDETARRALALMQAKYGQRNAILFRD